MLSLLLPFMSSFMRCTLPTIELTTSRKRSIGSRHMIGVVALVEGDHHLGPPQALWHHGFDHVDDVGFVDVGQLIALAGEALDVLPKGFTQLLHAVA